MMNPVNFTDPKLGLKWNNPLLVRGTTHAEFSFWVRGVLSRCSGVERMAFWLHTGVDVRDGFSRS